MIKDGIFLAINSQPFHNQNNNLAISNAEIGVLFFNKGALKWHIFYQNTANYCYK
jgi:hypothetical protein